MADNYVRAADRLQPDRTGWAWPFRERADAIGTPSAATH